MIAPEPEGSFDDDAPPASLEARIEEVVDQYFEDAVSGRTRDLRSLVLSHPDLAPWLEMRLSLVAAMWDAGRSRSHADDIRCPHCGHPVAVEGSLGSASGLSASTASGGARITCPACGSAFRIERDELSHWNLRDGEDLPRSIGRFQILGVLGRGSFGVVYKARDDRLGRFVALKVPRGGAFRSKGDEERFLRESRSAAGLAHPSIVPVFEIGDDGGIPYIVSELITGETLAERISRGRGSFRETAILVAEIADALDHAHAQGVIHRDIKPQNILLDAEGHPHVTDFGLARRDEGEVTVTIDGQVLGTPAYMSPEQARGDQDLVDSRSDIYSLGVVLYELLTGQRPFNGSRSRVLYQVVHDEPRPPRALSDHIPRDLETICLRAMAKEPHRRYASAPALADDLRRYLRGVPILARPVGRIERAWRWARRNPAVAVLVSAVAALLVVTSLVGSTLAVRASRARDEASARLSRLHAATGFRLVQAGDLPQALPWFVEAERADTSRGPRERVHIVRGESTLARIPRLVRLWAHPIRGRSIALSKDAKVVLVLSGGAAWLRTLASVEGRDGDEPLLLAHGAAVERIALRPDGARAVTGGIDGRVVVWEVASATPRATIVVGVAPITQASFTARGELLIADSAGRIVVSHGESGAPESAAFDHHGGAVRSAVSSADGRLIASGGDDGRVLVWEKNAPESPIFTGRHRGAITSIAFSPDSRRIVTGSIDGRAILWDVETGRAAVPPFAQGGWVVDVGFDRAGERIVTAGSDGTAVVWDANTGARVHTGVRHGLGVTRALFDSTGRRVISASHDSLVRVRDALTGEEVVPALRHSVVVYDVALSEDGRFLGTIAQNGIARIWDLAVAEPTLFRALEYGGATQGEASADGRFLAVAGEQGQARIHDVRARKFLARAPYHGGSIRALVFDRSGRFLATGGDDGVAIIENLEDEATLDVLGPYTSAVRCIQFNAGGDRFALGTAGGEVVIRDAANGGALSALPRHATSVEALAFSPDGRFLATGADDGTVRIDDLGDLESSPVSFRHEGMVRCLAWSPDGSAIASGSDDWRVYLTTVKGTRVQLLQHVALVSTLEFHSDGERILTASADGTARIWDVRTGAQLVPEMRHAAALSAARFSPDGSMVVTGSRDRSAAVWDAETGEQLLPPLGHRSPVIDAFFSPDGRTVTTFSEGGAIGIWSVPPGTTPAADLSLAARLLSGTRGDPSAGVVPIHFTEYLPSWVELRGRRKDLFSISPAGVLAWRFREVIAAVEAGAWTTVASALESFDPEDRRAAHGLGFAPLLARAHLELGRYEAGSRALAHARELDPADPWLAYEAALAALVLGDEAAYRSAVADLLATHGDSRQIDVLNWTVWAAGIGDGAEIDFELVESIARRAVGLAPRSGDLRNALALVLARRGRFAAALAEIEESVSLREGVGNAFDWSLEALARLGAGEREAAKPALERARSWRAERDPRVQVADGPWSWSDWLSLDLLIAEVDRGLGR